MSKSIIQTDYLRILSEDPNLRKILEGQAPHQLKTSSNLTFFLYATIVKQQLSTRVGNVLLARFLELYNHQEPSSAAVWATADEKLRELGLSKAKAGYMKNIARYDIEEGISHEIFQQMTDQEVISYLTKIKGVGKWTANLFLMSALGRPDVFPADDLILQKALALIYSLDRSNKKLLAKEMERISLQWSPLRTYASIHLWRWMDNQ